MFFFFKGMEAITIRLSIVEIGRRKYRPDWQAALRAQDKERAGGRWFPCRLHTP
ncbi:hypothetical protein EBBID32_11470 [Sphingobium indicum BiD32]|uniref:Uncharacterized protein n=1 Tax=Sphingobium indicum BiD32 TaxID=1301087 RepID=N1MJ62_9SPHN|nr:hypothetical protein EBBID32_11470 [Sphingobium indicum BiD32]